MPFIIGGALVGGVIIGGVTYDDEHHRYRDHSNHSRYGDSEVRQNIASYENRVNNKKAEVDRLYQKYQNLPSYDLDKAKAEIKQELENKIAKDKKELAEIDRMIDKINQLELQSRR